jgi:hypothetical protein
MKRRGWFLVPLILLCASTLSLGQLWSGIVSPSRATDWSSAGVAGGIPSGSWAQCGSTIAAGASAATINSAISSCPANHYVQLGAGTFNLSTGISLVAKDHIAVRGMGANQTLLVFSGDDGCLGTPADVCFRSSDINYFLGPANIANWTANYAPGTTTITLSSTANLSVGKMITVDQTDDTSDDGGIFVCYTPKGVCSTNGDNGGSLRSNRSQQQMVTVTGISGSNVSISPPIRMPNWTSGKSPQAWWATNPASFDGIENVSITTTSSGKTGIEFFNCNDCWVKAVRVVGPPGRSHVMLFQSGKDTIEDSYFYKTNDGASVNYGVEAFPSGDSLIQNNIFEQIQAPYPANAACSGCVWGYNFDVNNVFTGGTFEDQGATPHSVGADFYLYEGNIGAGFNSDNFHGTHNLLTNFRNYWNGYQKNEGNFATGSTTPIIMLAYSRFYNVIGNVLGNSAVHKTYENTVLSPSSNQVIYSIGFGNGVPNDPDTVITLMRWGNYANCSGAAPCGTANFSSSEVPSNLTGAQAAFSNPVPASDSLPASFYLTSQPSWWPSGKAWPPIGPDVSGGDVKYCSGGSQTGTYVLTAAQCPGGTASTVAAGHVVSNPAMDCYLNTMGGAPDGTGGALSFNASSCYPSSGVVAGNPPGGGTSLDPPTGLTAVVD